MWAHKKLLLSSLSDQNLRVDFSRMFKRILSLSSLFVSDLHRNEIVEIQVNKNTMMMHDALLYMLS